MNFIKIEPNANGSHNNISNPNLTPDNFPLEGWAVLHPLLGDFSDLENFPFGDIEVEEIDGYPTVTSWVPGVLPPPEPIPEPTPTQLDRVEAQATYTAMMTDTLLEEG